MKRVHHLLLAQLVFFLQLFKKPLVGHLLDPARNQRPLGADVAQGWQDAVVVVTVVIPLAKASVVHLLVKRANQHHRAVAFAQPVNEIGVAVFVPELLVKLSPDFGQSFLSLEDLLGW